LKGNGVGGWKGLSSQLFFFFFFFFESAFVFRNM
jgi:hypothetical protein